MVLPTAAQVSATFSVQRSRKPKKTNNPAFARLSHKRGRPGHPGRPFVFEAASERTIRRPGILPVHARASLWYSPPMGRYYKLRHLLWVLSISCFGGTASAEHRTDELVVLTSDEHSYVTLKDGHVSGAVGERFDCAFGLLGLRYSLRFVPLGRGVRLFEEGHAAALIPAVEGNRFDGFADWVGPFAQSKAYWYFRSSGPRRYGAFDLKADGTVTTKHESAWRVYLEENGYRFGPFAETLEQGFALLLAGKTDAILGADIALMRDSFRQEVLTQIKPVLAYDIALGAYLRRDFLDGEPGRRAQLQQALNACRVTG
jgi:hypothetical protein